jgi:hypothetical protein
MFSNQRHDVTSQIGQYYAALNNRIMNLYLQISIDYNNDIIWFFVEGHNLSNFQRMLASIQELSAELEAFTPRWRFVFRGRTHTASWLLNILRQRANTIRRRIDDFTDTLPKRMGAGAA